MGHVRNDPARIHPDFQPAEILPHHVSPGTACDMLGQWIARPGHVYWREEMDGLSGAAFRRVLPAILTHTFVTDGFLASVASANGGKLATFDRPLSKLFADSVEIIA